ncbi:DUF982 domain-containing protein [Neorhizobium galegae]|uniref:DUF982 domain-containing protein n=1 Tax=Neorhizobium galegae TaxID=399 RepID=UPI001280603F|nr:DUF982 domain-containing protein [Neorhizobium galegae]KAA9386909.1 DUF982 domain-containing protein [Neorhizobium galegae]MCM2502041.1 DUF982 domain-containing protein [Neorhizobium galegae]
MAAKMWDSPVCVGDDLIFGPFQAHQFLKSRRKHHLDPSLAAAEAAIRAALDGRVTVDEARERFQAALNSAKLS